MECKKLFNMELFFAVVLVILLTITILIVFSFIIAKITEFIFKWKKRQFSKKNFWQTFVISLLICLIISGMVCGGVL